MDGAATGRQAPDMDTSPSSPVAARPISIVLVARLTDAATRAGLESLLEDAVASGASIGFHAPLAPDRNRAFWDEVDAELADGHLLMLVARAGDGAVVGCVQLAASPKQNAPHRAEVRKLLVHSTRRGRGVARQLMEALYDLARSHGRTTLQLDTRAGDVGEPFYRRSGWVQAGILPDHTLEADGSYHDAVLFCRRL